MKLYFYVYRLLFEKFGVKTTGEGFNLLLHTVELNDDKLVTYESFCELVLSPEHFEIIFPDNDVLNVQYNDETRERCSILTPDDDSSRLTLFGRLHKIVLGSVGPLTNSTPSSHKGNLAFSRSQSRNNAVNVLSSSPAPADTDTDISLHNKSEYHPTTTTIAHHSDIFGVAPSAVHDSRTETESKSYEHV